MSSFDEIYNRHLKDIRARTPEAIDRLKWSRKQVLEEQTRQLRKVVAHAQTHSAFYKDRLSEIDASRMELADLKRIPILTKADVMDHWDDLVTDPRLKLHDLNEHIEALSAGTKTNAYFLDEYYAAVTGGTSGKRGLFLWDWETLVVTTNITYRMLAQRDAAQGHHGPRRMAVICASSRAHASRMLFPTSLDPMREVRVYPANRPLRETIRDLNDWQPTEIVGYASVVHELLEHAKEEELRIQPRWVATNSEPLDEDARTLAQGQWGINIHNTWGSVEIGVAGVEGDSMNGMIVAEDYLIFEPVDAAYQPVGTNELANRLLATKLFGSVMPLIRYEMTDMVTFGEGFCREAPGMRRLIEIKGRADASFRYGKVSIHPIIFWEAMEDTQEVGEYQVLQTERGAHVRILLHGDLDLQAMAKRLEESLSQAGLDNPHVQVEAVKDLPRDPKTNKLKRFVPLP